jgi:hypothetical protein
MSDVAVASVVMVAVVTVSSAVALWVVGMRFLRHRNQQRREETATRPHTLFTCSTV